jgi:sestrin
MKVIMESDGPLPRPWRHYLAMLGASCYSCEYLARNQLELFLSTGGDHSWLRDSVNAVPRKIQCLKNLNELMAHRPWALDSSHIEEVTVSGRWSSAELVHAILILSTFHSLPALVFGSGIKIEDDLMAPGESCMCSTELFADPLVDNEPKWEDAAPLPKCFSLNDSAPSLLQRLLQQATTGRTPSSSQRSVSSTGEEPITAFEGFGSLNENPSSGLSSPQVTAKQPVPRMASKMGDEEKTELAAIMLAQPKWRCLISNSLRQESHSEYKDFVQRAESILHNVSFSWEDHGMMVLSRQMPEASDCINEENMHALDFTTNTIGDTAIDSTTTVREAIVKYVQRMYGVFHDDYRYDGLNRILPVIHKAYLKKLACYPERLTRVDYMRMRKFEGFTSKDLIHYAHIVSQTKRVVELTWTMKALMSYQAGNRD